MGGLVDWWICGFVDWLISLLGNMVIENFDPKYFEFALA